MMGCQSTAPVSHRPHTRKRARGTLIAHSTCIKCKRLTPLGQSHCNRHKPKAKPKASSTARGMTSEYRRNRAVILSLSTLCVLCGRPGADSADHLVPRAYGGGNALINLLPSHLSCNSARGKRELNAKQLERAKQFQLRYADALRMHRYG